MDSETLGGAAVAPDDQQRRRQRKKKPSSHLKWNCEADNTFGSVLLKDSVVSDVSQVVLFFVFIRQKKKAVRGSVVNNFSEVITHKFNFFSVRLDLEKAFHSDSNKAAVDVQLNFRKELLTRCW